ncbi:MAG: hypothetical protein EXR63_05470 [Dehalococcoidia bacterium]|nr:hypothetical protein [Dehalococcoidia bacterium]MSQ36570.1 hypothetical protein [Dehalococcoidia bacterium]
MAVTRILHAAGNLQATLALAEHPAIDAIEADLWVRAGHAYAQHARPLWPLPLAVSRRGVHTDARDGVTLANLLAAVHGRAELVIDLRSWLGDPAPDIAAALHRLPERSHVLITCEAWVIADRLRAWLPGVRVAYSVRSEGQLRRFVQGQIEGSLAPTAVMVRHTLLHSAAEVAGLRQWAPSVGAWTVDDPARAAELVAWGVDSLTSNSVGVLAGVTREVSHSP